MKKIVSIAAGMFFLLLASACQSSGSGTKGADASSAEGKVIRSQEKVFPGFTVRDLGGQEHNLDKYRGKILVLNLFATWCPPCRMEIPDFVKLQTEYKNDLIIAGLSYDKTGADKVMDFAAKMGINYDLYWGSDEIAAYVGLRGIPHTLIIDAEGRVRESFVGYREKSVFEDAIKKILK